VVISNRPDARGIEIAKARGLNVVCLPSRGLDREVYDRTVVDELQRHHVDLVCLAGYMRLLSATFIRAFPERILNIHPRCCRHSRASTRSTRLSTTACASPAARYTSRRRPRRGPIILQAAVAVEDGDTVDTLSARILKEEHRIYSEGIAIVLAGKYRIQGRRVIL
jgi:phosphoribosylglycinamide formyltransferase-1